MTRILIADDHRVLRDGLRMVLSAEPDISVCGEAADGAEAVRKVAQLAPDLLLLDIAMPGVGGIEALAALAENEVPTRVLLLTASIEQDDLLTAVQLGARGVVMKDVPASLLLRAIRAVAAGEFWIGRDRVTNLLEALRPHGHHDATHAHDHGLTARELVIVAGVVAAYGNRDIAQALGISEKTVKVHLTNVFDKLGVSSRVELAMFTMRHALHLPAFPPH